MPTIETATGPVDSAALGRVLMHEHVFIISPEMKDNIPEEWGDEDTRMDDAAKRLQDLKNSGIDAILDPTALGLGRYIPRIGQLAERIDLKIIVASGLYTFNELGHYWGGRGPGTGPNGSDPMVNLFVKDIIEGIAGTGIKAGVLKCATDKPGLTPGVERVLRACAKAHRATGAPITTHTDAASKRGLEQQEVFRSEGVDLTHVVIGHSGDTDDIGYLEELIAAGSILGMDRFGIDGYLTTPQRVAVIAEMCSRGYADRMVLSHDASCYLDWIPGEIPPSTMPHWHYLHISQDVLPMLREAGVTDAQIETMLVDTPRRFLENCGAY
ncbi:MAG: phosphotriesterase-related protein [Ilumatobacteraceae bacterium]